MTIAPLVVGLSLIVLAAFLIRWHFRAWKQHQADSTIDDRELRYYRFQFRRRLFVSALLILLGVLIPAGDAMMMQLQQRLPAMVAGYWMLVLAITMLVMLLALIDLAAGNAHRTLGPSRDCRGGASSKPRSHGCDAEYRNGDTPG